MFGFAVNRRNRHFDSGKYPVTRLNIPVISIGNLSVGGTGKTPFAKMLARVLLQMNHKPAIVSSGYHRKTKGEIVVTDGKTIFCKPEDCGDEMLMLAKSLSVPILVHDKKHLAAKAASERFDVDCIIVDDGFQHRWLHRNLDIVLIDNSIFRDPKLLPAGKLRENVSSLQRADLICMMNGQVSSDLNKEIEQNKLIHAETIILEPYCLNEHKHDIVLNAVVLTAIANPKRFSESVKSQGIAVQREFFFHDHHYFSSKDIEKVIDFANRNRHEDIITTEKDAVKLKGFLDDFSSAGLSLWVLPIDVRITESEDAFTKRLMEIFEK